MTDNVENSTPMETSAQEDIQPQAAPIVEAEASQPVAEAPVEAPAEPEAISAFASLKPKQELQGIVKKIELFGVFVDVGLGADGLVHISQLRQEHVKNVTDVVKEGEPITVWVRKVDPAGRLDLTMIKPRGLEWNEIREGQVVTGKVSRIEKFGVFVEIGAERPGMIHVSELASGFVNQPEDAVKVGDEIQAKVLKVNRKKKQIDLSRKALEEPIAQAAAAEEDDETPTAIELALRQAMAGTEMGAAYEERRQSRKEKDRKKADKRRQEQDDILARTLKNRVK